MYKKMGFDILPSELSEIDGWKYKTELPWEVVEKVAAKGKEWINEPDIFNRIHMSSIKIWNDYDLGMKVKTLFEDRMIGEDGDITETRDYNSYVRQMDDIAQLKYDETKSYIKSGRIGDIGCAVGSWIKLACREDKFRESDFYGIEVARHLYDVCNQRKNNGGFSNPYIFFSQKNAVTGLVFRENSMNTIHTSSLTHEIYSYGMKGDLEKFISNGYKELVIGGVWINRDVVGPDNREDEIILELNDKDGINIVEYESINDREKLKTHLQRLSTYSRFLRFARDFRHDQGYRLDYDILTAEDKKQVRIKLSDACEFIEKKDYFDNWMSEMHEFFCSMNFNEWNSALTDAGFYIDPRSCQYRNDWIVKNRYEGKVKLFKENNGSLIEMDYPVTHMIMIGIKI